ncbi:APC family permease [Microbacterium terrisoli]|jgi:amino acid transporter|uniref:APC family permease n=1 Tax=Microbacterium terrisoli TaxID=3242192 RepID=UPI002805C0DE|nr:APC family permease [Microbacterium protaetiae]
MDDDSTVLAQQQTGHLKKTLGRFDIIFLVMSAVLSIEVLAETASFGAETFTWTLVLAVFFLIPYAMIFAETGSTFIGEGGAYLWVRRAFGRPAGALASILSWITQPVWVGGSMAFLASETWDSFISPLPHGSLGDWVFKIVFIWVTVVAAILSLAKAKWIPSLGAILKLVFLALFLITTVIYAAQHGVEKLDLASFSPTLVGFLSLVPLLLFAYLGFESANSASGEMKNPKRDIPVSIARSGIVSAACYLLPILAMLLVLPSKTITGIGGLMDAVQTVFGVYGPLAGPLVFLAAVMFVVILASQGASWMIISDRMQALTAADGAFFGGFFGAFHKKLGTPVHVNLLSGVVATVFLIAAMQITGSSAALFQVVLNISISTFLLSYLLIIPAAIKLRFAYPDVERPYRVPGRNRVFAALGIVAFLWVLLGSWVTVFPGTLENLFGIEYDFSDNWGVEQGPFELLTIGTLVVLAVLALVGYARGARIRAQRPLPDTTALTTIDDESMAHEGDR